MKHVELIHHLKSKSYTKLEIKRYDNDCFLVVYIGDTSHVFIDEKGNRKRYRHGWQITKWLEEKFAISLESK